MTIMLDTKTTLPPCAHEPEVYQDETLDSAWSDLDPATRQHASEKLALARRGCAGCPMLVDCLYRAVVEVDVSGFVACTTEADRAMIRQQLGIEIAPTSLTPYGAARVGGGPVSHEAVMTARQAYPKDTCQQLAERLGCSTSTIKRHLRRARQESVAAAAEQAPAQRRTPTVEDVLDAFDLLESAQMA